MLSIRDEIYSCAAWRRHAETVPLLVSTKGTSPLVIPLYRAPEYSPDWGCVPGEEGGCFRSHVSPHPDWYVGGEAYSELSLSRRTRAFLPSAKCAMQATTRSRRSSGSSNRMRPSSRRNSLKWQPTTVSAARGWDETFTSTAPSSLAEFRTKESTADIRSATCTGIVGRTSEGSVNRVTTCRST